MTFLSEKRAPLLGLLICLSWYLLRILQQNAPYDTGDGIMHFFISEASWSKPYLLLDHWGKPLFTLFSSPFAHWSYTGILLFNLLVFTLTTVGAWRILKLLQVATLWKFVFPFVLLGSVQYNITILSGLTEPLFSLFLLWASYFYLNKKGLLAALLIGCLPFLRSEGQLPLILMVLLFVLNKEYKNLPFLLVPFALYSLLGALVLGEPWWYFTRSPYHMDNDIYGTGSYLHYLINWKEYLGFVGLVMVVFAVLGLGFCLKNRYKPHPWGFIALSAGTFIGIIASHSYFWGSGTNGSLGLLRIATQALPSFVLVLIYFINELEKTQRFKSLLHLFPYLTILFIVLTVNYPSASKVDQYLLSASSFVEKNIAPNKRLYYYHPLIGFGLKANPLIESDEAFQYRVEDPESPFANFELGDFLVWEAHFGPVEMNLPLSSIMEHPNLAPIAKYGEKESEVWVFEYVPTQHKINHPIKTNWTLRKDIPAARFEGEYYNISPLQSKQGGNKFNCTIELSKEATLVVSSEENYQAFPLAKGQNQVDFTLLKNTEYLVYLWNKNTEPVEIKAGRIQEQKTLFSPLWKQP